ncbi:MAG: deoxynucleoside kinase [Clostridia bacterium]|nr:deoxynucleoside kinase [Clostridia bacterium]
MGKLIVLEGLDGSGKGTHAGILTRRLKAMNLPVKKITFPDYKERSSELVKMYLSGEFGKKPEDVGAYAASAFYAVDRYASFKKYWKTFYDEGGIVIADRYTTSNATHQMGKLPEEQWDAFLAWLTDFEYNKLGLPSPDITLYLDMDPDISQRLMAQRYHGDERKKDIHEKDLSYLRFCRRSALYAGKKWGWKTVQLCDDERAFSIEENAQRIFDIVSKEVL